MLVVAVTMEKAFEDEVVVRIRDKLKSKYIDADVKEFLTNLKTTKLMSYLRKYGK